MSDKQKPLFDVDSYQLGMPADVRHQYERETFIAVGRENAIHLANTVPILAGRVALLSASDTLRLSNVDVTVAELKAPLGRPLGGFALKGLEIVQEPLF